MSVAAKITALFEALTVADVQALSPAERRRFADWCQLWAKRAEQRAQAPKSGVLLDLQDRQRDV